MRNHALPTTCSRLIIIKLPAVHFFPFKMCFFSHLDTCLSNYVQISRNLFRWTKAIEYADYYERALINGVLSIQRGSDPGVMIYMLPLAPGQSKAVSYHGWGTKYDSFWCCYGTGNMKLLLFSLYNKLLLLLAPPVFH
jgi:hypothetical protein